MAWRDYPLKKRALIRAVIFSLVILVVSIIWNVTSDETDVLLRAQDILTIVIATVVYVGLMFVVERGLKSRGG